jgi:hypothetical protein
LSLRFLPHEPAAEVCRSADARWVTVGLLLYGAVSLLAIVVCLANRTDAFRGVLLVVVSVPWSLVLTLALDARPTKPLDGPWGEVWGMGVGLTGIALNCVLFWLFVRLTVGRGPRGEQSSAADRPRE